jgi:hypothetical protein
MDAREDGLAGKERREGRFAAFFFASLSKFFSLFGIPLSKMLFFLSKFPCLKFYFFYFFLDGPSFPLLAQWICPQREWEGKIIRLHHGPYCFQYEKILPYTMAMEIFFWISALIKYFKKMVQFHQAYK